jgi:hypothetical protein
LPPFFALLGYQPVGEVQGTTEYDEQQDPLQRAAKVDYAALNVQISLGDIHCG